MREPLPTSNHQRAPAPLLPAPLLLLLSVVMLATCRKKRKRGEEKKKRRKKSQAGTGLSLVRPVQRYGLWEREITCPIAVLYSGGI